MVSIRKNSMNLFKIKLFVYKKPIQKRALTTEKRFLDALDSMLSDCSFTKLTIDAIALEAGLTRGAFIKRFGSKKQALFVLWERYCERASMEMGRIKATLPEYKLLEDACTHMSVSLEKIQTLDFSANRAMHENFQENLEIDPTTKRIFLECVELMRSAQRHFLKNKNYTDSGAFAAAQLLVTINYNYVLKAMSGLPPAPEDRHKMVGEIIALALNR